MDLVILIHSAVTWALCGLIWTVQIALYPLFGRTGSESFADYHAAHMQRITFIVGPLMLAEIATAAWLLLVAGVNDFWFVLSLPFLLVNFASTGLVQVPLHKKLERGFDRDAWMRLTRSNWIRTFSWTARAVLVGIWLAGMLDG